MIQKALDEQRGAFAGRLERVGGRFGVLLAKGASALPGTPSPGEPLPPWEPPLTEAEAAELRRLAPETKETARTEGIALAADLRQAIAKLDPQSLIGLASWLNIWGPPEEYFEPTHQGSEVKLELLAGLAACCQKRPESEAGPHDYQRALDLADEVIARIELMLLADALATATVDPAKAQLGYLTRLRRLHVRGENTVEHAEALALEVLAPYERPLRAGLGFTAEDLILFFRAVLEVVQDEVNQVMELEFTSIADAVERGMKATRESDANAWAAQARECMGAVHEKLGGAMVFNVEQLLEAEPRLSRPAVEGIVAAFALAIGDGDATRYTWPLDENPLSARPILALEHGYMLPVPGFMGRDFLGLIASAVNRHNLRLPSNYLALAAEDCALALMRRIFADSDVHGRLFYRSGDQRFETDGLVLCEDVAIVIEAKARPLSFKAARGDVLRLQSDLRDAVTEGLRQGVRLADLLLSGAAVVFEDKAGSAVLDVTFGQITEVYVLNPHLTPILDLGSQPAVLAAAGVVTQGRSAVPVFINDLRMIADFVETPAEFIDYLRWRTDQPLEQLMGFDEGDLFGAYLLNDDFRYLAERPAARLQGYYTSQFDDYYTPGVGAHRSGPKPRKMAPRIVANFVRAQCDTRPAGWLGAATTAIGLGMMDFAFIDVKAAEVAGRAHRDKAAHMLVRESCALVALAPGMTWQEALSLTKASIPPVVTNVVFVSQQPKGTKIRWAMRLQPGPT